MSRVSPLDQPPIPARKWSVTFISETAFHGYTVAVVRGDSISQVIEAFKASVGDPVRIVAAVRL